MKKLLLTGFGPFLKNESNPTKEIAERLDGKTIGGYEVVGRILPVEFVESGRVLEEHLDEVVPDAVILLGLASGRTKVTPERIAINCDDGRGPDNVGFIPQGEKVRVDGPDGLFTTLPIKEMVERLMEAGLPAEISNSAGTYVCNHVMYEALYLLAQQERAVPAGFIHVPADHGLALHHSIASMSQSDIEKAIRLCIESLA